jgi:hypothetical protein
MNALLESSLGRWWLGVDAASADASTLRIVFERPLPGWGWFLILCVCALAGWWSYRGLRGSRGGRIALAVARGSLLLLLVLLLAGPSLRVGRESVEPDWVIVLVDRSQSMSIRDESGAAGTRDSRDDRLRAALAETAPMWARLAEERRVVWLGFADGAFELRDPSGDASAPHERLGEAQGDRTRIDDALQQAMQRAAARPVSGIVVLSDGRTSAEPTRATLRRLQGAAAKVFAVPFGSEVARGDLAVAKVEQPARAFVRDEVPVRVEIERALADAGGSGAPARVRLVDAKDGRVLAEAELPSFGPEETEVSTTLVARPSEAGIADWRIELDAGEDDLVAENNTRDLRIELIDRPLRVLYVEGYPRWEYRYLKNLLIREDRIDSSIMLLSADRDFAQEGNMPLARLPRDASEFADFDLFIMGDVPAGFFTPDQLEAMRDQVALRGTGLLWIGGERSTPRSWEGSALAELLPMRPPLALASTSGPVTVVAAPEAERLGLLRVGSGEGWPDELADPRTGWSRLEWVQSIPSEQLKPTAEVLAYALAEVDGSAAGRTTPLILSMKFGAGQVLYVATDEIWRWRYGRGERYTEQVWLPLVRMLGREALAGGGDGARLRVLPVRTRVGQSARIELAVADARYADGGEATIPATVVGPDGATRDIELQRLPQGGAYAASYAPERLGAHVVRIAGGAFAGVEATFACERPDDELRQAAADHAVLTAMALETDGAVLHPDELLRLEELLPRRSVTTEHATYESLWDAPLALALIVLIASAEWIGRRFLRLA